MYVYRFDIKVSIQSAVGGALLSRSSRKGISL